MTREEIPKLQGVDLDRAVARALGWVEDTVTVKGPIGGPYYRQLSAWRTGDGERIAQVEWTPQLSIYQAKELEDEIERRGLQEEYMEALSNLLIPEGPVVWFRDLWRLLRATPAERCLAFLLAVEANDVA